MASKLMGTDLPPTSDQVRLSVHGIELARVQDSADMMEANLHGGVELGQHREQATESFLRERTRGHQVHINRNRVPMG